MFVLYRFYEKNPKSILGTPGQFQGLNGGVLLLRLDRMRENVLFNHYLTTEGITELAYRYGFTNTSLGITTIPFLYLQMFLKKVYRIVFEKNVCFLQELKIGTVW